MCATRTMDAPTKGLDQVTDRVKQAFWLWGLFALLVLGLHMACTPEPEQMRLVPNQPPETTVQGAPLDSSNAFHRYHVYWAGFDPDGEVLEYRVAVTDSNIGPELSDYRSTTATDSIIEFVANNEVVLSHSFWVYAIDNEGQRDETPDRVYFNAVDVNRPVPVITCAEKTVDEQTSALGFSDTLPSAGTCVRFCWTATDADVGGRIRAYRIKLSTDNAFTEIPGDSTAATYCNLASGVYEFLVEAVDNAGAESLNPARWFWVVNYEPDTRITGMIATWTRRDPPTHEEVIVDFRAGQVDSPACRWPDGVPTIRDSSRVTICFEANDRDGALTGFSYRIFRTDIVRCSTRPGAFSTWSEEECIGLPQAPPNSPDSVGSFFTSNDYEVFIRSRDNEGKSDATPPSVKFHVNFTPVLRGSGVFPGPGAVLTYSADSLVVRFTAEDVETGARGLSYRVILDGAYGRIVGPVSADNLLYQRWGPPAVGEHRITYSATDPGKRETTLNATFTVVP